VGANAVYSSNKWSDLAQNNQYIGWEISVPELREGSSLTECGGSSM